jgi:hypothetical protein
MDVVFLLEMASALHVICDLWLVASQDQGNYATAFCPWHLEPILAKMKIGTWKNTFRRMHLKVFFPRLRTSRKIQEQKRVLSF